MVDRSHVAAAHGPPAARGADHVINRPAELHTTDATAVKTETPGAGPRESEAPATETPAPPPAEAAPPAPTDEATVGPPGGSSTHGNQEAHDGVTITVITPVSDAPGAAVPADATTVPVTSSDPGAEATPPPTPPTSSVEPAPTTSTPPDAIAAG
jgi:hypothetical protein